MLPNEKCSYLKEGKRSSGKSIPHGRFLGKNGYTQILLQ